MVRAIRGAAFLAGMVLLVAATIGEVYQNKEFGIVVPIPPNVLFCPTPDTQHDHGPLFLLGTNDTKSCAHPDRNRYISVFAGYNAADVTKKLPDFLKWQCTHVAGGPCHPVPSGLQLAGLPSEAGRVDHNDGWIDIIVVTQAGTPDLTFDPSVPSINYSIDLHTRPEYFEQDLNIFRTILQTIRFSPK